MAVLSMLPFVSQEAGMIIPLTDVSCVSIPGNKANNGPDSTILSFFSHIGMNINKEKVTQNHF